MEQKNLTWVRLEHEPVLYHCATGGFLRELSVFGVFKGYDMILLRKSTDGAMGNYY